MAVGSIQLPTLLGGVTRAAQSQRLPHEVEEADNVVITLSRGPEKRAGTVMVDDAPIAVTNPLNAKHVSFIDRSETDRFVVFIDPTPSSVTLSTDLTTGPALGSRIRQAVTLAEGIVTGFDLAANIIYFIPIPATGTFSGVNTITNLGGGGMVPDPVTPTAFDLNGNLTDMIEVFRVSTGAEVPVSYPNNVSANTHALDFLFAYIAFSFEQAGADPRRRLRTLTIADTTLILNRLKPTALRGKPLTYRNAAGTINLRNTATHPQNVDAWRDFTHPPTVIRDLIADPIPVGELTDPNEDVDDDAFWYAREDDVGHEQGFYAATSATQPPWFTRIRTEAAGSTINGITFPVRMDFNGTQFTLDYPAWTVRYSGDSATNPGPSFIGSAISDIAFHQDRLFMASGEIVASSQAGDAFNLWINSEILQVDSDPIDQKLSNNNVSNIDALTQFKEALVLTTSGGRQFELRSDGPLSPNTAILRQSTAVRNEPNVKPVTLGDQMYFLSERNFANILNEYLFSPTATTNSANDVTQNAEGYIPAQASLLVPSQAHDLVFILTDAAVNEIFVYKSVWNEQRQKLMSTLFKWITNAANNIKSCHVFDEDLLLVIFRNNLYWFERVSVERPEDDTVGSAPNIESMGFQVRLDSKLSLQGVYDSGTNTTTWTVPYVDTAYDEIVLGPGWDVDVGGNSQRLAGTRFSPVVTVDGGTTELTVPGQYATNLNGDPEIAYVGKSYNMRLRLSQQYFRDQNGIALKGVVKLLSAIIRHKETGFYAVTVTALNRDPITYEFIFPRVGATFLDAEFVDEDGEFDVRILGEADSTTIDITNDSPLPSNIVDMEFRARFVPSRKDPTK